MTVNVSEGVSGGTGGAVGAVEGAPGAGDVSAGGDTPLAGDPGDGVSAIVDPALSDGAISEPDGSGASQQQGDAVVDGGSSGDYILKSVHEHEMKKTQSTWDTALAAKDKQIAELVSQTQNPSQPNPAQPQAPELPQFKGEEFIESLGNKDFQKALGLLAGPLRETIMATAREEIRQEVKAQVSDGNQVAQYENNFNALVAKHSLTTDEITRAKGAINAELQTNRNLMDPISALLVGKFGSMEAVAQIAMQNTPVPPDPNAAPQPNHIPPQVPGLSSLMNNNTPAGDGAVPGQSVPNSYRAAMQ